MAKRPTEADLDIEVTPEEIAAQTIDQQPPKEDEVEVVPREDLPEEPIAEFTDKEIAAGQDKTRGPDGKFLKAEVPPPGFVSKEALRETREENKRLMERMTTLLEIQQQREARAMQPKPAEKDPEVVPDKTRDPLGYIDYMDKRLGTIEGERAQTAQEREAAAREEQEMAAVLNVARPQYIEAAEADPTTPAIYQGLLDSFGRELMFVNANNPAFLQDQRGFLQRELTKLENAHIKFAVSNRMNAAEYMRGLAASRGVQPANMAAPQADTSRPPNTQQNTQPSIQQRQEMQQRHMSLGDAPGGEAPKQMDARAIAKMSNKEFAAFAKTMSESDLDAMMGGRG